MVVTTMSGGKRVLLLNSLADAQQKGTTGQCAFDFHNFNIIEKANDIPKQI